MENAKIIGYGAYIPKYRIKTEQIAAVWGADPNSIKNGLKINEKAVAGVDEDSATIGVEATKNALKRAQIDVSQIGAIYIGSESHPYAVNPSSTMIGDAIGAGPNYTAADTQFACKAGTAAMQMVLGLVESKKIKYGVAIGADTAQGMPGDALEYSAASGGAGFVMGLADEKDACAEILETVSYSTDTPDFWRRPKEDYPQHAGRFTGEPAYFKHMMGATNLLLKKTNTTIDDYDYFVFHMPNGKFPLLMAKKYKIPIEKLKPSLVVEKIGNTYSGSSILGLCAVLDIAKSNDRILITSYGSGAGSDSFSIKVCKGIESKRGNALLVEDYIKNKQYINYAIYAKIRGKI
ncbi:MAG: hydroxymethylglutaryl-CoA synthase [Candidatus Nanohalarchaeota archaeon]|nr:MAG: hydroxymethylglutaryl-CoA synthase [Candidatus Nanohaloarchaeota archaeon]